ncbi:hypothetical protein RhiJN_15749 [Ceratobasidium sp. AG-Ba]|nr:hypothetical protein RhiJN_15749 [Ceratobasidium sp. AG-Ba]
MSSISATQVSLLPHPAHSAHPPPGVPTINGCGYCRWVREYPPPPGTQLANNPGWPGCCRAPRPEDAPLIDKEHYAAIVAAWDQRALPSAVTTVRNTPSQRRSPIPAQFANTTPTGSPNLAPAEPVGVKSGTPPPTTPRRSDTLRREREQDRYSARRQGSGSEHVSPPPMRQNSYPHTDSRHGTIRASDGTRTVNVQPAIPSHWGRGGPGNGTPGMGTPPVSTNGAVTAEPLSLASLSASINQIKISSAMSDSGSESSRDSNTTVGTDSTDYLSDESEEELQRLAVQRAMEIERQRTEDAEYESARRGLRDIELTPPQQWGMNGHTARPSVRSTQYLSFGDMAQYGTSGRRQR